MTPARPMTPFSFGIHGACSFFAREVVRLRVLLEVGDLLLEVELRDAADAEHLFERRDGDELAEDAGNDDDVDGTTTKLAFEIVRERITLLHERRTQARLVDRLR